MLYFKHYFVAFIVLLSSFSCADQEQAKESILLRESIPGVDSNTENIDAMSIDLTVEDFETIFGPQSNKVSPFVDEWDSYYKDSCVIEINVVSGKDLQLLETENKTVHLEDKRITSAVEYDAEVKEDVFYLLATITQKDNRSLLLYTLDVKLEKGPLKGATVHLRDGLIPLSFQEPFQAVFVLPEQMRIKPGPVKFRIVRFKAK